jgi:hypothetical protein
MQDYSNFDSMALVLEPEYPENRNRRPDPWPCCCNCLSRAASSGGAPRRGSIKFRSAPSGVTLEGEHLTRAGRLPKLRHNFLKNGTSSGYGGLPVSGGNS